MKFDFLDSLTFPSDLKNTAGCIPCYVPKCKLKY